MKRICAGAVAIMLLLSAFFLFSACDTLTAQEGVEVLAAAYENSVSKWGDIYQYHEKVTQKASVEKSGYIIDSVVNVHCYHDGEEYHKDKDLALTINDQYYISVMDEGGKETSTLKGSNMLTAGYSPHEESGVDALFLTASASESVKYCQGGVSAADVISSGWFEERYSLAEKLSIFADLSAEDMEFVDTDDARGGAEKRFMSTTLTFKVSEEYIKSHPDSPLEGEYVSVYIVNVNLTGEPDYRISSVTVYKPEKLGAFTANYESYLLSITYLGPNISVPDRLSESGGKREWTEKNDLWTEGVNEGYLFKPDFI